MQPPDLITSTLKKTSTLTSTTTMAQSNTTVPDSRHVKTDMNASPHPHPYPDPLPIYTACVNSTAAFTHTLTTIAKTRNLPRLTYNRALTSLHIDFLAWGANAGAFTISQKRAATGNGESGIDPMGGCESLEWRLGLNWKEGRVEEIVRRLEGVRRVVEGVEGFVRRRMWREVEEGLERVGEEVRGLGGLDG